MKSSTISKTDDSKSKKEFKRKSSSNSTNRRGSMSKKQMEKEKEAVVSLGGGLVVRQDQAKKMNLRGKLASANNEVPTLKQTVHMAEGTAQGVSYETMDYVRDLRHPRQVVDNEKEKFKFWQADVGDISFQDKQRAVTEVEQELGIGATIYLRQMKFFAGMFFLFTLLSVP